MFNTLDLFAGIGGFSYGLEQTGGFRTAAFCEIDQAASKVLNKHWPDVPVYSDVSKLTKELLDADGITIDCITGGFPCQDISLAGKGAGLAGERSGLWYQFHRLIDEIKPKVVIAENVSALRSRGLEDVLRSLAEIGYDAEWHCIPASAVGAPHRRDRVWIIAYPIGSVCGSGTSIGNLSGQGRATCEAWGESLQSEDGEARTSYAEPLCETLAYTHIKRELQPQGPLEDQRGRSSDCGEDVAHSDHEGLQGFTGSSLSGGETPDRYSGPQSLCGDRFFKHRRDWPVEPNVGRVAHGVPKRVDRLKQLGNAIVPEIARLIGLQVMANIGEKQDA